MDHVVATAEENANESRSAQFSLLWLFSLAYSVQESRSTTPTEFTDK